MASAAPRRLLEILIDDATWEAAGEPRRHEWQAVISELLDEHHFDLPGHGTLRLLVTDAPSQVTLEAVEAGGATIAQVSIRISELNEQLIEYVATCREMVNCGQSANSPKLEALDIAKRLIHDEAAEVLQGLCRVLRPDHPTARRLFTLVVSLRYDTTRLGSLD
jgi:uncharacterized protein (UPF0262 family)